MTNEAGSYAFPVLKPGTYSISAALPGFKTSIVTDRVAQVGIPAQVNIILQIGEISEQVTVSGVGEELINTQTAELSTTIAQELVENLPIETRNYFDLLALSPNTSPQYLSTGNLSFGQHSMRRVSAAGSFESSGVFAAGNRASASNVSVDGANTQIANYNQTTNIQSASTIKELKLQTASANAEFGNGSNAVNVITKGGTNEFHGELFWQHRNDNLDAIGFFTNLAGSQLPEYKRNKFGGTIGGPILKDKLLFFQNFEGSRLRQAVQGNTRTLTQAERGGDFSQTRLFEGGELAQVRPIYNPFDFDSATGLRQPFPGNIIPTSLLDPAMQILLPFSPLPNTTIDGIPQYSGLEGTEFDENQYTTRIDFEQSENTKIYGRYTFAERKAQRQGLLPPLDGESTPASSHNAVLNWTQIFSPTFINDLSVSYTRPKWGIGRPITNVPDVAAQMGLQNASPLGGSPGISVTNFTLADSRLFVWDPTQNTYQAKNDISFHRGRHSFKFGAHLTDRRLYYLIQSVDKGRFAFLNTYTAACPLGNTVCEGAAAAAGMPLGGMAVSDMILGAADLVDLQLRAVDWHGQQKYFGTYFQDTWQVHPRLTLNLGLRYEYWRPWTLPRNSATTFDFSGDGRLVYRFMNTFTDLGRQSSSIGGLQVLR